MANPLPDRWATRDLPVLRRVAEKIEVDGEREVRADVLSTELGLDERDVLRSLVALLESGYIEGMQFETDARYVMATDLTERGRRAVGIWPTGEGVDALVDALQQAAESTDDPEERGALRRAAGAVLGVGRDVMTDVMGAVIAKSITG